MYLFQIDSEEERLPDEKYVEELAKKLPQGTDKTPEVLEEALKGLPDKWVFILPKRVFLASGGGIIVVFL